MGQSKEERINLLNTRIKNLKDAIKNPNTFDHVIFSSSTPKQDRIRVWASTLEQLHELGAYPQPINTISGYIASELKALGASKAIPYARQVLSYKYKDDTKIHSETLLSHEIAQIREAKLREKVNSEEVNRAINQPYIDNLQEDIQVFTELTKKLESAPFVEYLDLDMLDEHFTAKKEGRKLIREMLDSRTSVMSEKLHMLIHGFIEGTKSHAYSEYVNVLVKTVTITPKQTVRLLTGRVSKIESLYEPKNIFEARHSGFYGSRCDECGSWRVDKRYNTDKHKDYLFCFACKLWSMIKTEDLMQKEI